MQFAASVNLLVMKKDLLNTLVHVRHVMEYIGVNAVADKLGVEGSNNSVFISLSVHSWWLKMHLFAIAIY